MKNKVIKICLVTVILFLFILFGLYKLFYIEEENNRLLNHVVAVGEKLFNYKVAHRVLPETLEEIGISDRYCLLFIKCFTIKYKVSDDRQDYKLAARSNEEWVVYFSPDWKRALVYCKDKYRGGCAYWGFGFVESYSGSRTDWPVYRRSKPEFATPSAWPDL